MSSSPSIDASQLEAGRRIQLTLTDMRLTTWGNVLLENRSQIDWTLRDLHIIPGQDSASFKNLKTTIKEKIREKVHRDRRNTKFDVANPDCVRIGSKNVGKLGNLDCIVLLDKGQVDFPFPYKHHYSTVPHTRSLTCQEGKFFGTEEHNAAAFALAELVDNALAASAMQEGERRIEIHFYDSDSVSNPASIHVLDNGCGMDSETLRLSLKYKAPKEGRRSQFADPTTTTATVEEGQDSDDNEKVHPMYINSNISKFGAGLKHAVFWLGEETRIMTKREDKNVCEVFLSSKEMEARELQENEDPWIVQQYSGEAGVVRDPSASATVQELITRKEKLKPSFTHVVVHNIRMSILYLLRQKDVSGSYKYPSIEKQLSHIYHYYLHGRDGSGSSSKKVKIFVHRHDAKGREISVISLADLEDWRQDLETRFVATSAPDPYLFAIEVTPYEKTKKSKRVVELKVGGIIRYHPFLLDRETKPGGTLTRKRDNPEAPDVEIIEDDENGSNCSPTSSSGAAENQHDNAVRKSGEFFHIWWNGRLIPHTKLESFDWCSPVEKMKVMEKLFKSYGRISGSLFFNSGVSDITDNKLNLTTTTELYNIFNEKTKTIGGQETTTFTRVEGRVESGLRSKRMAPSAKKNFEKWLTDCQRFDKQVLYADPLDTEEAKLTPSPPTHCYKYGTATWDEQTFSAGDAVKLLSSTTNSNNNTPHVVGIIKCFLVPIVHCLRPGTSPFVPTMSPCQSPPCLAEVNAPLSSFVLEFHPISCYNNNGKYNNDGMKIVEMRLIDNTIVGPGARKLISQQLSDLNKMSLNVLGWGNDGRALQPGAIVPLDGILIPLVSFDIVNSSGTSLNGSLPYFETKISRKSICMFARVYQLMDNGKRVLHYTSNICHYRNFPQTQEKGYYFKGLDMKKMHIEGLGNFMITFRTYIDYIDPKKFTPVGTVSVRPLSRGTRSRSSTPVPSVRSTNSSGAEFINGNNNFLPTDPPFEREWTMEVDSLGRKILREGDSLIRMPYLEIPFSVVAGSPVSLSIEEFGDERSRVRIGEPFHIILSLKDSVGIITTPNDWDIFTSQVPSITALPNKKWQELSLNFTSGRVSVSEERLVIEDVIATGYLLADEWIDSKVEVRLDFGKKTLKISSGHIRFQYGLPATLEVDEPKPFENGSRPILNCRVLDTSRNVILYTEDKKKPIVLKCKIYKEGEEELLVSATILASSTHGPKAMDERIDLPELKTGHCPQVTLTCVLSFLHLPPVSVTLTAIPSTRPEMIRLYLRTGDSSDPQEIPHESEIIRKINETLSFSFKLFDGRGGHIPFDGSKDKLRISWLDETIKLPFGEEDLPDFVIPSTVLKKKLFVTKLKIAGYEGPKVEHKFILTSTPLTPHSIQGLFLKAFSSSADPCQGQPNFLPRGQEVRVPIGEPLPDLAVKVCDAYGNVITELDPDDRSLLEITGTPFDISYEGQLSEPPPTLECSTFHIRSIRVNKPALGQMSLTLSYQNFQDTLLLNLVPGLPSALAFEINGELQKNPGTLSLLNESSVQIVAFLLDDSQNKTRPNEEVSLTLTLGPVKEWDPAQIRNGPSRELSIKRGGVGRADFGKLTVSNPQKTVTRGRCPMKSNPCEGRCFGKSKFVRVDATLSGKEVSSIVFFHVMSRPETPHNLVVTLLERAFCYEAGGSFQLTVTLESEDGQQFLPAVKEHLILDLIKVGDTNAINRFSVAATNVQEGVYTFGAGTVPTRSGLYLAEFIYTDTTKGIRITESFSQKLSITPGKAVKLSPSPKQDLDSANLSVSNDPHNPESRVIVQDLKLVLTDKFGNICKPGTNSDETENDLNGEVTLKFLNATDQPTNLLENVELLSTRFLLKDGAVVIPPLIVQTNLSLNNITKHTIRFTATLATNPEEEIFYDLEFTFFNNVQVRKEIGKLESEIEALNHRITSGNESIANIETERNNLLTDLQNKEMAETQQRIALAQFFGPDNPTANLTTGQDVADRERVLATKMERLSAREAQYSQQTNIQLGPWSEEDHVLGTVGHLARVKHSEGPPVQRVLSWHLQQNLGVIAVEREEKGLELRNRYPDEKYMLLDIIRGGEGNWNEGPQTRLSGTGNPIYARFLLELNAGGGEDGRWRRASIQKVFDKLMGNLIMVDTLPDATRFMKEYNSNRNNRGSCPTILTRDGHRLLSSGIIGGQSGSAPELNRLPLRMGLGVNPEIARIQYQLGTLHALKEVIEIKELSINKLNQYERSSKPLECVNLKKKVQEDIQQRDMIWAKLQELRNGGGAAGPGGSREGMGPGRRSQANRTRRPSSTPIPEEVNLSNKRPRVQK